MKYNRANCEYCGNLYVVGKKCPYCGAKNSRHRLLISAIKAAGEKGLTTRACAQLLNCGIHTVSKYFSCEDMIYEEETGPRNHITYYWAGGI